MRVFRWSHGHTFAGGLVAGLVVSHGWWLIALLLAVFLLGAATGRFWYGLHRAKAAVVDELEQRRRLAREKIKSERAKRRDHLVQATLGRTRLRRMLEGEYRRGVEDAVKEMSSRSSGTVES